MVATVFLESILPADTALRLLNSGAVQLFGGTASNGLLPSTIADSLFRQDRFESGGSTWLAARSAIGDPPIELVIAGPRDRYVAPFQNAARSGVVGVALVALLALALTSFLTRRVTSSMESLADAASAVAAGELDRRVIANGTDEVRRVASAFNSMTESLRRTLGALSQRQALAAVGEVAASLSHEVRNALTSIRVDLQRADEKLTENAETRALIGRAMDSVKRLDASVTGSLRAAREGTQSVRRTFDLREVLASAARGAEGAFVERKAQLVAPAPDIPLRVRGDPLALEQMFLNVLLNAAQSLSPSGGGQALLTARADGDVVRVVIEDTGVGIAENELDRVVDPFYSTRSNGTGLGLPIARQVATTHGGALSISSELGHGTTVEIRLPSLPQRPNENGV